MDSEKEGGMERRRRRRGGGGEVHAKGWRRRK